MSKKLIYLISFVLVLSLVGSASADLIAHWKFNNDGADSIGAADCSLLNGATYSTDSKEGSGSLSLDGIDDYAIPAADPVLYAPFSTETVAIWFKAETTSGTQVLYDEGGYTNGLSIRINADTLQAAVRMAFNQATASTGFTSTEWTHVAVTFDNGSLRLYVNGAEQASATAGFNTVPNHTNASGIGARNAQEAFGNEFTGDYFAGLIDDVQMYDNAFSAAEIADLLAGRPRGRAPDPTDGAMHEGTWVNLSWTPGAYAVSHDVYLGDNFDDVNDGTGETFRGNQAETDFIVGIPARPYPEGLAPGTTYYWRIDEVNELHPDSPWKGYVWSFVTPPSTAYDSDPPDGARFVDADLTLSWTPGAKAKLHHVYLGDSAADVNDGVGGTYKGPVAGPTYTPGALELDKTYYWRVDEFDGLATHKGDLWRFGTLPEITITDPNLVGWWKFDRSFGTTALDWSGHGNPGTLEGDPRWVAGYDGNALELAGYDWVSIDGYKGVLGGHAFTITAWIWAAQNGEIIGWGQPTNGQRVEFRITNLRLRCENGGGARNVQGYTDVTDFQWHHVAVTVKENATVSYPDVILYLDGENDTISTTSDQQFNLVANYDVTIGQRYNRSVSRFFAGVIDDVRIYDKVLTAEEIKQTMRGDPTLAWDPKPTNGSTLNINDAMPLSWSPGDSASEHDVYLGTDRTAVADADTSTAGIYRGRQNATSYTAPEGVEWGQSYYWRIDEYNTDATISTGRVWSFTVADYLTVDDFESYNDLDPSNPESNRIFNAWIDGYEQPTNGSQVGYTEPPFCEQTIVRSGGQSMPLAYDNSGTARYSEATLTLSYPRDWTEQGVGVLSLWFYGDPANTAAPLYITLNGSATVYHGDTDAALTGIWTEWRIPLTDFSNQGVVLTNVNTISIGLGDRNNPQPGGSGTMYFDDIRLYRSR